MDDDFYHPVPYNITKFLTNLGAKGMFLFNGKNCTFLPVPLLHYSIAHLYVDHCIYAEESVARIKFAYSQGHQIGSHTWAHKNLSTLTSEQVNFEMARTEQAIQRLIGIQIAFTHPPYGKYNSTVCQVAANRNQKLDNWSFDSGDLIGATPAESNGAYDKLVNDHPDSVLALNHEVYSTFLFFSFAIQ